MKLVESWRKMTLRFACFVAPLLFLVCLVTPVRNRIINLAMLIAVALSGGGWLVREWRKLPVRYTIILLLTLPVVFLSLPARTARNPEAMSRAYVRGLERYVGTEYWWGGETRLGIDCSGLIRAGMMDACLIEGLKNFDGALLRHAAWLWWHDESAEALGDGYRNLTRPVFEGKSLNEMDYSDLRSGDLAVAGGGSHILAYIGERRWIQADPNAGEVIIEKTPSKNRWFVGAVKIVRWVVLDP